MKLPPELLKSFETLVEVENLKFDNQLDKNLMELSAKASANGVLRSGHSAMMVREIAADSFGLQAEFYYELILKCMDAHNLGADVENKDSIVAAIETQLLKAAVLANQKANNSPSIRTQSESTQSHLQDFVSLRHETETKRIGVKLDLTIAANSRSGNNSSEVPNMVFNAPVASVVTGDNNVTDVAQNITTVQREAAAQALSELLESANRILDSKSGDLAEIADAVTLLDSEIRSSAPNALTVKITFAHLGTMVRTVPGLSVLYIGLKTAAGMVGVHLP